MAQYRTESHQRVAKRNNFFTEPEEVSQFQRGQAPVIAHQQMVLQGSNQRYVAYPAEQKKSKDKDPRQDIKASNSNLASS
jgi:hypothetical protein